MTLTIPNQVTLARLALIPFFCYFVRFPQDRNYMAVALAIFLVASLTDWLDGYLARRLNQVTDLGKLLDPLADKVLITAALVSLTYLQRVEDWTVTLILTREFLITGLRGMLTAKSPVAVMGASNLGKWKTFLQMIAIGMLLVAHDPAGPMRWWGSALYYVALLLTVISAADYLWKSWDTLRMPAQEPSAPQ